MKKMKVLAAVIMTAMLAGSLAGCENKDDVSAVVPKKKTENEVKSTVTELMKPVMNCMSKVSEVSPASVTVADKAAATEEPQAEISQASESSGSDKSGSDGSVQNNSKASDPGSAASGKSKSNDAGSGGSNSSAQNKPKSDNAGSGSSGGSLGKSKSNNSVPNNPNPANAGSGGSAPSNPNTNSSGSGSGNSAPTPVPHTHNWKEHTTVRQVWVPNIVVVDDYEDRDKVVGYHECDCGARFEYGEEAAFHEHMETNILEAAKNGTLDSCPCGGSNAFEWIETEHVKVGSHEEDHGHYENETYVDYYYCDCGARK